LPDALIKQQNEAKKNAQKRSADQDALAKKTTLEEASDNADAEESNSSVQQLIDSIPEKSNGYVIYLDHFFLLDYVNLFQNE
jgi:hypothetical protein